jgi:hypothetical protein
MMLQVDLATFDGLQNIKDRKRPLIISMRRDETRAAKS